MATGIQEPRREVKEQAGAMWNDAKELARGTFAQQQRTAASSLGSFAEALRKSARDMQGDSQQAGVARFAQSAADGLERLSGTLRSKDLDSFVRDAESLARRQPALFFGAAVAAGFLAVRFLKSSKADTGPTEGASFASTESFQKTEF